MALPTNSFRPRRYYRSKFRESKYLLAAEATDLQLESLEQLREYIKNTYGDIAVGPAFRVDKTAANQLVIRPGEAWNDGIPFVLKSGTDALVNSGILPTDVSLSDLSATTSDIGGKKLTFAPTVTNDNYSVVIEADEELVKDAGSSGAIDPFLQGVNVGEGTEHKLRLIYKIHVVKTSDLTSSPTFDLLSNGITNHFVNEIEVTPTGLSSFVISAVDISPDVNGADRTVLFDNTDKKLPFSTDANDYIFGKLVDSDGNIFTITSITTSDGGNTVQFRIDREVGVNSSSPKAGLPVITTNVPYKLIKRDHYVTDSVGTPLGKRYMRIADVTFTSPNLSNPTDLRISSDINTFGIDPNARLMEGGVISWEEGIGLLSFSSDLEVRFPGNIGTAKIAAGSITMSSVGDVAYIMLDRSATSDYYVVPTVTAKANVPSSVDVYVLAERGAIRVHFPHNGSIGTGETGYLGGFGSELVKDLSRDNLTDMLTEVEMDEVFAETFDVQDDVDLTKTQSMTFEPFNKLFRSGSSARFVDYLGDTLPESDPTDPWTKEGTQASAVALSILTLTDSSVGDRVAYYRDEASLTTLAQAMMHSRLRVTAASGSHPFSMAMQDGTSGKHFRLEITTTDTRLIDGLGTVLQTVANNGLIYHEYKLLKVGDVAVQWYIDGVLQGSYPYADITTGSGGSSRMSFGTDLPTSNASTATVDIDFVKFNIYTSILHSKDIFRKGSVFYEGEVTPDSDSPVWTKVDGGGGITAVPSAAGILVITDAIGANLINYYRDESSIVRHGDAELEIRVNISATGRSSFQKFGIRLEDGVKDIAAWIRDVAGQLKVGLYNATSATLVGAEYNIDDDKLYAIKIRKSQDENIELLIDNVLQTSRSYDEFTDSSANNRVSFGSFDVSSQYIASIDFVQYALPGAEPLAATPVRDLLGVVSTDDPAPTILLSSDNGQTWFEATDRDAISITDYEHAGANLFARIALSKINSALTDYGIYYNKTGFETDGPFRYVELTAIDGQTVFNLPFVYTPGVNELIVTYKPLAGSGRELFLGEDYTENDATHVTLSFPAVAGDKLKFRVIFVTSPIVVPIGGVFAGHDHSGAGGESDILRPAEIDCTGDVNVAGDLNVTGTINGTSPLKLSGDNTGVKVGDASLASGNLDMEVQVADGAAARLKLTKGADNWTIEHKNVSDDLSINQNGVEKIKVQSALTTINTDINTSHKITADKLTVNDLTVLRSSTIFNAITIVPNNEQTDHTNIDPNISSYVLCNDSTGVNNLGIQAGVEIGQLLYITNLNSNFNVNTSGLIVIGGGGFTVSTHESVTFIWDGTYWSCIGRNH